MLFLKNLFARYFLNLAKVPDQYHRVGDDKMNKLLSSFFAHLISLFAAANASFFSVMGSKVAYTSNVEVAYELEKLKWKYYLDIQLYCLIFIILKC